MASESNGSNFVWFLAGAAVGAAIATLYAPQSGRETRRYIRRKSEEGREALADAGKDVVDRGREYYEKGRKLAEEAGGLLERGRKVVAG
jgi:gas vesicle protein